MQETFSEKCDNSYSVQMVASLNLLTSGIRCINLDNNNMCLLFGKKERPKICIALIPMKEMCGNNYLEAIQYLEKIEKETMPDK